MITEDGYEIPPMSKEEVRASNIEMDRMMEHFEGICEYCGRKRMNCDETCFSMR